MKVSVLVVLLLSVFIFGCTKKSKPKAVAAFTEVTNPSDPCQDIVKAFLKNMAVAGQIGDPSFSDAFFTETQKDIFDVTLTGFEGEILTNFSYLVKISRNEETKDCKVVSSELKGKTEHQ